MAPIPMHTKSHHTGFTLLEVLVVMIIIALVASIAVVKIGDFSLSERRAPMFIKLLRAKINLAQNYAIYSMQTIGIRISRDQIQFVQLNASLHPPRWQIIDPHLLAAQQKIPPEIKLSVRTIGSPQVKTLTALNLAPQIIIFASGELVPFAIFVQQSNSAQIYTLRGTASGALD